MKKIFYSIFVFLLIFSSNSYSAAIIRQDDNPKESLESLETSGISRLEQLQAHLKSNLKKFQEVIEAQYENRLDPVKAKEFTDLRINLEKNIELIRREIAVEESSDLLSPATSSTTKKPSAKEALLKAIVDNGLDLKKRIEIIQNSLLTVDPNINMNFYRQNILQL